jgi:small-conductance mechanosensitive channel
MWNLLESLLIGAAVFVGFYLLTYPADRAIRRFASGVTDSVQQLLRHSTRVALLVLGAVCALGSAGVDVGALIASLGLIGFAAGFALKDVLANFVAGILILVYEPFKRGDRVDLAGKQGTVSAVDFRYTELEADGARILVPNQTAFTNTIVIHSAPAAAPDTASGE